MRDWLIPSIKHTEKEDIIRETQENKGRESTCFHVFFLLVMAVVPLIFSNAVSSTISQVEKRQHLVQCSKFQREVQNGHVGRSTAFFVIQRLLHSPIPFHVGRNWMRLSREEGKKRT